MSGEQGDRSRINREVYVRICGSPGLQCPGRPGVSPTAAPKRLTSIFVARQGLKTAFSIQDRLSASGKTGTRQRRANRTQVPDLHKCGLEGYLNSHTVGSKTYRVVREAPFDKILGEIATAVQSIKALGGMHGKDDQP